MNSSCPARIAGEYGPMAAGAPVAVTASRIAVYAALMTLPLRRQRVQTRIFFVPPPIEARTV